MKKCPYCGYQNTDETKVCGRCFAELPQNLSENTKENSEPDRETTRHKKRSDI